MFLRRIFGLFIVLLVLGGLFSMNGRNQYGYQAGYVQGFVAGQQAASGGEVGGTAVVLPPAPAYPTYHYPGFSFFGFLFKGLVSFMFIMLLLGLLFGRGHRHGRRGHHKWHKWQEEWHQSGHKPPWYNDDQTDEPVMKA
jgi:hypothetical protein